MEKHFEVLTKIFNCKETQEDCQHSTCDHYFVCCELALAFDEVAEEQKQRDAVIAEGSIVPDGPNLLNHEIAELIRRS